MLEGGQEIEARHVVVACGPETPHFLDESLECTVEEVENFEVQGKPSQTNFGILEGWTGLPDIFIEDDGTHVYYGLRDGDDLSGYKIGLHERRDFRAALNYFSKRFNSNLSYGSSAVDKENRINFLGSKPCFYTFAKDNKFCYKTSSNGVHYCYGFTGTGFKFLPLHGKIIYEKCIKESSKILHPVQSQSPAIAMKAKL